MEYARTGRQTEKLPPAVSVGMSDGTRGISAMSCSMSSAMAGPGRNRPYVTCDLWLLSSLSFLKLESPIPSKSRMWGRTTCLGGLLLV